LKELDVSYNRIAGSGQCPCSGRVSCHLSRACRRIVPKDYEFLALRRFNVDETDVLLHPEVVTEGSGGDGDVVV
jgi:hypothetical protein